MNERTRRWLVAIAALVAIAVTARLGVWQLSRAAEKEALQAGLAERGSMPPLPQAELARDAATAASQWHRTTRVRGRWLAQHTGSDQVFWTLDIALALAAAALVWPWQRSLAQVRRIAAPRPPRRLAALALVPSPLRKDMP